MGQSTTTTPTCEITSESQLILCQLQADAELINSLASFFQLNVF